VAGTPVYALIPSLVSKLVKALVGLIPGLSGFRRASKKPRGR
jgi:hypothetical protein